MSSFNIGGGGSEDMSAGGDAARERNHSDKGMGDEGLARGGTSPRDNIGYSRWKDLSQDATEIESGEGSDFRCFEDNGISRREGRSEFPCGHHQWVVPWNNRADDSNWIATEHRGVPCHVFSGGGAGGATGGSSKESKAVTGGGNLIGKKEVARFAAVAAFKIGVLFRVGVDCIGNFKKKVGTFSWGGAAPSDECFFCSVDSLIDLLGRSFWNFG